MAGAQPVHDAVYEVVLRLGGSFSAEHGIGQLKTGLLNEVKDPVALEMMRAIKTGARPQRHSQSRQGARLTKGTCP